MTGHDSDLFEAMFALLATLEPEVRRGRMFGCPAAYVGRRMAACVFGAEIGLRVPAGIAGAALGAGRAVPFRPYGRPAMREWLALAGGQAALEGHQDLFAAALAHARANGG